MGNDGAKSVYVYEKERKLDDKNDLEEAVLRGDWQKDIDESPQTDPQAMNQRLASNKGQVTFDIQWTRNGGHTTQTLF